MNDKQRYRRLRLLIGRLNKERKTQGKKIDILCNDLIAAHRDFIKKFDTLSFKANFYESIVGITNLNKLFDTVCRFIEDEIPDVNTTLFLRKPEGFELHISQSHQPITLKKQPLEDCFTAELVDCICKSNKICTLDDMFAMGLQANPTMLSKTSPLTIPLGQLGSSLGFLLLYRSSEKKLTHDELKNISAITPGLSLAIESCQALCRSVD